MASIETTGTDTQATQRTDRGWKPYRLSVRQYLGMIKAGIFPPETNVELLGGILVRQMTKGIPHDYTLGELCEQLRSLLPPGQMLREDKSLVLGPRKRPEPDVTIVAGPHSLYKHRDPEAKDAALVVEVSDSTYAYDRGVKWRLYAAAKVPAYWIVNLVRRQVEVYRQPTGAGAEAKYQLAETYGEDAAVPVLIDGTEVGRIAVRDILP